MPTVVSFHTLHDANISVCKDGELLAVLELERLFDVRYFCSAPKRSKFIEQWQRAIDIICQFTNIHCFDIAVTSWVMPSQREILQQLVTADKWVTVDHHMAHAAIGFYDSPFECAIILSYDGNGNDGTFNIFLGSRTEGVKHLKWVGLNLGTPYRQLATAMPEVTGGQHDMEEISTYMRFAPLALSGKVMGYAALGNVRSEWVPAMREYYERFVTPMAAVFTLGEKIGVRMEPNGLGEDEARDVAATSQHVFTQLLSEQVEGLLPVLQEEGCDGIVLTGGCALNVHANQFMVEKYGVPVHVPAAPNDCGISVGAAWAITPPQTYSSIQYCGFPCWDASSLNHLITERRPERVTPKTVAELLIDGAILGVVRGRQEFGPRALGHRSVLCYPDREDLKEKLNKLKSREWFRPLCPSVAIESVPKLFQRSTTQPSSTDGCMRTQVTEQSSAACMKCGENGEDWLPTSPYMSFAPQLTAHARQAFPAICHFDGTARLQTVCHEDDEWFHTLLTEVANCNGGYGILLNTSFNVKGKPILNRIATALDIMDSSPEGSFDYVIVEDWLFKPQRKN